MNKFFAVCLASVCIWVGGCENSIEIVSDSSKVEPPPQREPTAREIERHKIEWWWLQGMGEKPPAMPKRFYNPATAEDYDNAHRYLERNPEKPAPKPQIKRPWEPELYGPS